MATPVLSSPTVLSNGCQMTFAASPAYAGALTVDPTKSTITVVSEGYNSSGVLGTISRTVRIISATGTTTITCELSDPIYDDDNTGAGKSGTAPTVVLDAGAITSATPDSNAALGSTTVTNNSTLDYPKIIAQWVFKDGHAPAQRKTAAWFERVQASHAFDVACVTIGVTEAVLVAGALGGTGSFTVREAVTTPGGFAGIVAPSTGTAEAAVGADGFMYIWPTAGTVSNLDVISGTTRTFTASANGTGGATRSFTVSTMTEVAREGTRGPAAVYTIYQAQFDPLNWDGLGTDAAYGPARRWFVAYPTVGDADSILDSRTATAAQMNEYVDDVFLDPADTLTANLKTIYIDPTTTAACGTITGTFVDREWATVRTAGVLSAVIRMIGPQTASPIRYQGPVGYSVHRINLTLTGSGSPVYGDFVAYAANTRWGIVLSWDGTELVYVSMSTAFATGQTLQFFESGGVAGNNPLRGYGATTSSGSTAIGTTVTSGDVVLGLSSGATCTLSGAPAAAGSDAAAGATGTPVATLMVALNKGNATAGGTNGLADGATILMRRGDYTFGTYAFGYRTETRWFAPVFTPDAGLVASDVRIVNGPTDGLRTPLASLVGVSVEPLVANAVYNTTTRTDVTGQYKRRLVHTDGCECFGWSRTQNSTMAAGSWDATISNNHSHRNIANGVAGYLCDVAVNTIASDIFSGSSSGLNLLVTRCDASDTAYHSDTVQFVGGEDNRIFRFMDNRDRPSSQGPVFSNASGLTVQNIAYEQVFGDADATSQVAQLGNGTFRNMVFKGMTVGDAFTFNGGSGAVTLDRVVFRDCFFQSVSTVSTVNNLFGTYFNNCHFQTGTARGLNQTSGSTDADLFVQVATPANDDYYRPKAGSVLLNRGSTLGGRDATGRLLSSDAGARPSIGGLQPLATMTATVDGNAITSGGSAAASGIPGGSTTLVFTVGGPTGAVLVVDAGSVGGGLSAMVPPTLPRTLTSGGTTTTATFTATLGSSPGTFNVGTDALADFTGTVTWASASDFPFRARMGGSFRNPTGIRRR
jgi:hypothetical protein